MKNKKIAIIAMFSAIGGVLMCFDFPLPMFLSFMKIDISDLPVIVGGFIFGPVECIIIAALKVLIKLAIKTTSTLYVGELANFIGSIMYAFPASFAYDKIKNKKRAIFGLVLGTLFSSVVITICNMSFIFPFYMNLFHMGEDKIIAMSNKILPFIDSIPKVYLLSVLPFNIVKYSIVSIITFMFYKRISSIIKNI